MEEFNFKSRSFYLSLPTKRNPKVILAVDNSRISKISFELYNPFSLKAKMFKCVCAFLFSYLNDLMIYILSLEKEKKSDFVKCLEKKLQRPIVTSLYYSTAKDKIVIQLNSNNNIIGYAKVALNDIGKKHLLNERKAINILSERSLVTQALGFDYYRGMPYLLVKKLKGNIHLVKKSNLIMTLDSFKMDKKHLLCSHPRVLQIKKMAEENDLKNLSNILNEVVVTSNEFYFEVMEHGDFAPWNIVSSKNTSTPFDFEYFEEKGLEYLDLIKYYFQEGRLVKKYGKDKLLKFVSKQVNLIESIKLIIIFLIKEIIIKKEEKQSFSFELQILELIHDGKK